jgi:hypothetical protein
MTTATDIHVADLGLTAPLETLWRAPDQRS